ncbi:MAG: flagellar hook basal-body protein [Myxococcota bacterium]|jgi:flagellar basal body rod protein FlgG|nr:hypothetical protein [Myxococcales bacterium]MEC7750741.1 flagellar hook basal-body protein [Myxococcota bacterium]HBU48186.1 hypothetical protein [Myxococcales bacterium]|tara:strand:- start:3327 stop:4085 length:759 start_codon:yes stop_codon:yes gene_type:complete
MADGIWTSMSGAVAREKRLHHVANDLANLGSVGYRRHAVSFKQHLPGEQHDIVEQAPLDMSLRVVNRDTAMVKVDESRIREEQGSLRSTGNQLDVALRGKQAYFVVEGADGQELITRDGRFRQRADGQLTTIDGLLVLGSGGPLTVPPETARISVTATGELRTGDALIGQLRLEYAPPEKLRHVGGNRFEADELEAAEDVEVAQGYVEESTVNAVAAMVDLIALQRGFQAQIKGIEHYKQMDSAAIGLLRRF